MVMNRSTLVHLASRGSAGRAWTSVAVALTVALTAALLVGGSASAATAIEQSASQRAVRQVAAPAGRRSMDGGPAGSAASKGNRTAAVARPADYQRRPDVIDYIDGLVATEHFDRDDLMRLFADVRFSATASRLMTASGPTSVRRDWNVYRARFVEPVRLAAGYQFWEENAALLERAEREFGVPAEIIVGILGVETVYGRNTGSFRVIDALTTLAFDYPRTDAARQRDRSAFFREQPTEALRMTRDSGTDPTTLRGPYAGAIGMPQFMPGSIRSDAIDYDGDGRIDLVDSPADIIGSVANYLARRGWVRDQPTYLPLSGTSPIDPEQQARIDAMVEAGSVPTLSYASLIAVGLATSATPIEPLALIDLPSGSDVMGRPVTSYLAGTQNFHVITRYNRSYFYAFSVVELGSTIKALRDVRR